MVDLLLVPRQGIFWREVTQRRPPVTAWLLTVRVAAFTYGPLMLVPCLVAIGGILDGRLAAVPTVDLPLCWLLLGVDGLLRDGASPLLIAASIVGYGLWRASRIAAAPAAR